MMVVHTACSDFGWNQLQNKTLELDRLQFAGEMIRRIIRVRELSDKLRKIFAQVPKMSFRIDCL
jgi:hypothetical protein